MAGRYLLTGAQLGMISGLAKSGDTKEIQDLIDTIQDEQYLRDSFYIVSEDIKDIRNLWQVEASDDRCG